MLQINSSSNKENSFKIQGGYIYSLTKYVDKVRRKIKINLMWSSFLFQNYDINFAFHEIEGEKSQVKKEQGEPYSSKFISLQPHVCVSKDNNEQHTIML